MPEQVQVTPDELECIHCGKAVRPLPVVYGLPTPETEARARRGEFILGGCIVG